jgi:hypothetical protein
VASYGRALYGATNPNAGYPANGDLDAWGGHKWPAGVPASLLGTTSYKNKTNGQTLRVQMRKELVPLWNLAFQICDEKYHYPIWAQGPSDGKPWGPWGYSNRPISGTQRASGHSGALSVDINAPYNPYSYTFISNMPPAMVADLEALGFYWGGRYQGQKYDAMHYGFCRKPGTVPLYIARAKQILGIAAPKPPAPKPPVPKPPAEDIVTPADIDAIANAVVAKLQGTVQEYTDPYAAWQGKDAYPDLSYKKASALSYQYASGAFRDTQILRGVKPS